jgi:hypothetical protein
MTAVLHAEHPDSGTQGQVLQFEGSTRPKDRGRVAKNDPEEDKHR